MGERQESGVSFTGVGYTNGDDAKKENELRKRLRDNWERRPASRRSRAVWLKIKAGLSARLLLRRTRRIGVYFARNGLARFRGCIGVELFIRSATAEGNNSTSEESETPAFHREINNRHILDFQRI